MYYSFILPSLMQSLKKDLTSQLQDKSFHPCSRLHSLQFLRLCLFIIFIHTLSFSSSIFSLYHFQDISHRLYICSRIFPKHKQSTNLPYILLWLLVPSPSLLKCLVLLFLLVFVFLFHRFSIYYSLPFLPTIAIKMFWQNLPPMVISVLYHGII